MKTLTQGHEFGVTIVNNENRFLSESNWMVVFFLSINWMVVLSGSQSVKLNDKKWIGPKKKRQKMEQKE